MFAGVRLAEFFAATLSLTPSRNVIDADSNRTTSIKGGLLLSAEVKPYLIFSAEGIKEEIDGKASGADFEKSILVQKYGISSQTGLPLVYRTSYENSKTEDEQQTVKMGGELRYQPRPSAGSTEKTGSLELRSGRVFYQHLEVEDATGQVISEADIAEVSGGLELGKGGILEERWNYSSSNYPGIPGAGRSHEHRFQLAWKHTLSSSFNYELKGDGRLRDVSGQSERVISAGPRVEMSRAIGGQPWHWALSYYFSSTDLAGSDVRAHDERVSVYVPFSRGISITYGLNLKQMDGNAPSDTTGKSVVRNEVTISYRRPGSLLSVAGGYSHTRSDKEDVERVNANLSVPFASKVTLDITFSQEVHACIGGVGSILVRAGFNYRF